MQTFIDDDEGYFSWLAHHPDGFVVNAYQNPSPTYLVLHQSKCYHIQRWEGHQSTATYIKICSDDKADLREWARSKVFGTLKACRTCNPD